MTTNPKTKKLKIWIRLIVVLLCLALLGGISVLGINAHVKKSTSDQILSSEEAAELKGIDCILVLGCYVHDSGRPTDMLADRLRRGIELYQSGTSPKLLMSGDHGQKSYNEVKAMKLKALEADNSLVSLQVNCQEKLDNSRYCKDCAHFRPFEKNKNFGKCMRYIVLDWIGAYDDCTHCRFYEKKD